MNNFPWTSNIQKVIQTFAVRGCGKLNYSFYFKILCMIAHSTIFDLIYVYTRLLEMSFVLPDKGLFLLDWHQF